MLQRSARSPQRFGPANKERHNFKRGPKPDFGFCLTPDGTDESAKPALTEGPNYAESGLVREIVAKKSRRRVGTFFIKDGGSGSALVATDPQFKARFEVEQRKTIEFGKGFKEFSSPALDAFGHLAWLSAPVHNGAIGLVFKEAAQCVAAKTLLELFEPSLSVRGGFLQFATAIGIEAFGSVETPDLKRRIEAKQGRNLMSRPPGDDSHARAALALNAGERVADSGIWARCEAIDAEGRERAVVVEQ